MKPVIGYRLSCIDGENEKIEIIVTPHPVFKSGRKIFEVTEAEFRAISRWRQGEGMIQDLLPNWSAAKRELLLTGLSDEEFDTFTGDETPN